MGTKNVALGKSVSGPLAFGNYALGHAALRNVALGSQVSGDVARGNVTLGNVALRRLALGHFALGNLTGRPAGSRRLDPAH